MNKTKEIMDALEYYYDSMVSFDMKIADITVESDFLDLVENVTGLSKSVVIGELVSQERLNQILDVIKKLLVNGG